ncbi:hypothetical protein CO615_05855 [Lysobacteraceae bacterium NML75-0749]|nr:hypothetical protein CO615_05855 [Xanthomonadaceae bacterium NML75-0749]PJK01545.1 hypothetical protein CO611_00100 [Xanthomonadaceae bacterium NML03-0222]PJK04814.1 hypothetical protein CO609_03900 [Xanthomonadaceae bacterium NML91-0268]PJK07220.1 hypothetical protein CO612_00525 [Xanthomonadaceae bacterium NML71-0210]
MKPCALALIALTLSACVDSPPSEEKHDHLRRHIEAPLDKAKAVDALQQQAEDQRQQQLDALTQ